MATQAQILANRENARKSTGPRTPAGKAVASQNAVKHGLSARCDVISTEDQAEFDAYRDDMLAELYPVGPTESMLADRIVSLSWRLKRTDRIQNQVIDALHADHATPQPNPPRPDHPARSPERQRRGILHNRPEPSTNRPFLRKTNPIPQTRNVPEIPVKPRLTPNSPEMPRCKTNPNDPNSDTAPTQEFSHGICRSCPCEPAARNPALPPGIQILGVSHAKTI